MRNEKSTALFERAKKIAPGGVHSPVRSFSGMGQAPIFFQSADGAYLKSVDGDSYIDFCMSFGPLILGHQDPEVREQVERMVRTAWTFGACEPYSLELAEWLTTKIPFLEKLRFVSSGTEAVMSALRVARAATGKNKILKFEGCYHGHVDSLLVKAGSGLAGESASSSAGVPADVAINTLTIPLDSEVLLEEVFQREGKNLAAVIIEPLPANYGLLIQRKEFLQKLRTLCTKHSVLLIFDEVISGFRIGLQGMAGELDIQPDLVTYGKIIGGGFPVGCYGGRTDLMDLVAPNGPVYQAGTLSANPIGMVAGLTSLKKMERDNGWTVLQNRTRDFSLNLKSMFTAAGKDLDIAYHGSLFWIHPKTTQPITKISDIPNTLTANFKSLFLKALENGVYLAPNAYEVGFLSLAHTPEILEKAQQGLQKSLNG